MWGVLPDSDGKDVTVINQTLQAASNNSLPRAIELVLTGHIHLGEMLGFSGRQPPREASPQSRGSSGVVNQSQPSGCLLSLRLY